jgi:hypothetical protein
MSAAVQRTSSSSRVVNDKCLLVVPTPTSSPCTLLMSAAAQETSSTHVGYKVECLCIYTDKQQQQQQQELRVSMPANKRVDGPLLYV